MRVLLLLPALASCSGSDDGPPKDGKGTDDPLGGTWERIAVDVSSGVLLGALERDGELVVAGGQLAQGAGSGAATPAAPGPSSCPPRSSCSRSSTAGWSATRLTTDALHVVHGLGDEVLFFSGNLDQWGNHHGTVVRWSEGGDPIDLGSTCD